MQPFIPILRGSFLYLSRQSRLRRWMETSSLARSFTSRFVAGLRLEDGLEVCRRLAKENMQASLDYLGENVKTLDEARSSRDSYLAALRRIADAQLDATVSMKVTALGLDLSEDACRENTEVLVQEAQRVGSRIEMDMESSEYTDRNLSIAREMHSRYPGCVRAVIQAYLRRSETDILDLCRLKIPVRLCKGAYKEPPSIAFPGKKDVDANFVKLMKILLDSGTYPALATHDEAILNEAIRYADKDHFEFQMLYGVRRNLQRQLIQQNFRLRVYVPYGTAWYPYFMRRLAERPANVLFMVRNLFR